MIIQAAWLKVTTCIMILEKECALSFEDTLIPFTQEWFVLKFRIEKFYFFTLLFPLAMISIKI